MNIYLTQKNHQLLCELFGIEYTPMDFEPIIHKGEPITGWSKGLKLTEEHKKALSVSRKGKPSPKKGKPMTAEQKIKISQALKGKPKSEEHRKKLSEISKKQTNRDISGIGAYWKGRKRKSVV